MCDNCGKETNEAYETSNGEYYCLNCYEELEARAEAAYDAMRDDGLI